MTDQPIADPLVSADALTTALNENTAQLEAIQKKYRWQSVITILTVVALVVGGYATWENRQQRVRMCEEINEFRTINYNLWAPVLAVPPLPLKDDATDEERERYEAGLETRSNFERTVEEGFAPLDCGGG